MTMQMYVLCDCLREEVERLDGRTYEENLFSKKDDWALLVMYGRWAMQRIWALIIIEEKGLIILKKVAKEIERRIELL